MGGSGLPNYIRQPAPRSCSRSGHRVGGGKVRQNLTELLGRISTGSQVGQFSTESILQTGDHQAGQSVAALFADGSLLQEVSQQGKRVQCGLGDFHGGTGGNHALRFQSSLLGLGAGQEQDQTAW